MCTAMYTICDFTEAELFHFRPLSICKHVSIHDETINEIVLLAQFSTHHKNQVMLFNKIYADFHCHIAASYLSVGSRAYLTSVTTRSGDNLI